MIFSRCIGANANLEREIPITVSEKDNEIGVFCPYFASEKCIAGTQQLSLAETKTRVNESPRSSFADNFPRCLFAEANSITMV